jgi:1-acyl-sn-glycerol-3-phosphate acyltransferase
MSLRNNKLLFNLYQIYKLVIFLPLLGFATFLVVVIFLPTILFGSPSRMQIAGRCWARISSIITPMFVDVIFPEKIDPKQSYVIAANHQSQYDIFAVYGWIPADFRWVMKMELRKVPLIGFYCERAGHVYIDRSNHQSSVDSINRAKKHISGGTCILFFPEGTRSSNGKLLPFKKGAFRFAVDMKLPILPVTIVGTKDILPANTMALFPGRARLIIHDPINIDSYNHDNIEGLMEKVRFSIQKGLDDFSG